VCYNNRRLLHIFKALHYNSKRPIKSPDTIYIPGLNGIRAIAAWLVIISHIDQFQYLFNNESSNYYKNGLAGQAVNMFFVLSGFLITYLLLIEKNKKGVIAIKNFYIRRILRIWPLYYLVVFISILLIQQNILNGTSNNTATIFLYLFMMANVAFAFLLDIFTITPLWSVGVEEQFYLLWPHLVNKVKRPLLIFSIFIALYLLTKLTIYLIFYKSFIYSLIDYTRIDIMAMGGIGAVLIHEKRKIVKLIFHPVTQLISWGVLFYSLAFHVLRISSLVNNEMNSIFSLVIILNVGFNPEAIIKLENRIMNYFGQISYGLYIYHTLVIYGLSVVCNALSLECPKPVTYLLTILITISIAHLSYHYFESPILKMKKRFIIVRSSN